LTIVSLRSLLPSGSLSGLANTQIFATCAGPRNRRWRFHCVPESCAAWRDVRLSARAARRSPATRFRRRAVEGPVKGDDPAVTTTSLTTLTVEQLRRAIALEAEIEVLQKEFASLFVTPTPAARPLVVRQSGISAARRAGIAAAPKARWAKQKKAAAVAGIKWVLDLVSNCALCLDAV
jgi:hypothetical protein